MKSLAQKLLAAFWRQRAIDALSVAARAHEQRDLDRIIEEAERTLQAEPDSATMALAARCLPYVERMLAGQGDHAEADLVELQHDLAALVAVPTARALTADEIAKGYKAE
jgi:hypothetical protein